MGGSCWLAPRRLLSTKPFERALQVMGVSVRRRNPSMGFLERFRRKRKPQFPPVPDWKPDFSPEIAQIVERVRYYTDGNSDIAVFQHGTCVLLDDGLSDVEAPAFALSVLSQIFNYHPDMNPVPMDDGNVLVQYNHPAVNVVISTQAEANWAAIDLHHQRALATDEVLITPLGSNVFDDFGKKALYGRCFMFMDAQDPKVVAIHRKLSS